MMYKSRGYTKEEASGLKRPRDYKLFAIVCEGSKREPEYFELFRNMSLRVKVDIVKEQEENNKSAPNWVLDRAAGYARKHDLINEDELWLVIDVDRWKKEHIHTLIQHCTEKDMWNIAISNPCFEIWLLYHKCSDLTSIDCSNGGGLKAELVNHFQGGYHPNKAIPHVHKAIENAKDKDKDPNSLLPENRVTKVYNLVESLLDIIGICKYNSFIENMSC